MGTVESAPRAEAYVGINGVNVWGDIKKYVTDIEFTEIASGGTDGFDITMSDPDGRFISDWLIDKGTTLNAKIALTDWNAPGDNKVIDCGTFLCDAISVKGFPWSVTVKSLALPQNGTKNTKKWEKISVSAIAENICKYLGCTLKYYADNIVIESIEQSRQTDIDFLARLCSDYGFGIKAYRDSIVIFDRQRQDDAPPVNTIDITSLAEHGSIRLEDNEEGTYTAAHCNYKVKNSDKTYTYQCGKGSRILKLDTLAQSAKEAELKAKATMYEANTDRIKLKFTSLGGKADIYPGTNYYFTDLGAYSGKYAIDKVRHTLSGKAAYKIAVESHAVSVEKDNR